MKKKINDVDQYPMWIDTLKQAIRLYTTLLPLYSVNIILETTLQGAVERKLNPWQAISNLGRHLALPATTTQVPAEIGVWSATIPSQSTYLGFGGRPKMSPMRQTRHHATCHVLMPDCTSTRPLQMEARYCPQGAGRNIRTGKKEEKKHQEKGMPSNQIVQGRSDRQENKGPNYINHRWIWLLGEESWPREKAVFSKHRPHHTRDQT